MRTSALDSKKGRHPIKLPLFTVLQCFIGIPIDTNWCRMACPSRVCLTTIRCAAPGVHKLLTPDGFKGRLWNWRAKPEENRRCGRENAHGVYVVYIYIYMGTSQNTRYGSRPRTHTRSIPPDPYLDPYPVVLHDPYP